MDVSGTPPVLGHTKTAVDDEVQCMALLNTSVSVHILRQLGDTTRYIKLPLNPGKPNSADSRRQCTEFTEFKQNQIGIS